MFAFVDTANIYRDINQAYGRDKKFDYNVLIEALQGQKVTAYVNVIGEPSYKFGTYLSDQPNWHVEYKPVNKKGYVDWTVLITMAIMDVRGQGKITLVSGDPRYTPLIRKLDSEGQQVCVIAARPPKLPPSIEVIPILESETRSKPPMM